MLQFHHNLFVVAALADKYVIHIAVLIQLVAAREVLNLLWLKLYVLADILQVHAHRHVRRRPVPSPVHAKNVLRCSCVRETPRTIHPETSVCENRVYGPETARARQTVARRVHRDPAQRLALNALHELAEQRARAAEEDALVHGPQERLHLTGPVEHRSENKNLDYRGIEPRASSMLGTRSTN